jgi:hypothetical protein
VNDVNIKQKFIQQLYQWDTHNSSSKKTSSIHIIPITFGGSPNVHRISCNNQLLRKSHGPLLLPYILRQG